MNKLIKLSDTHYVVVDDSEIEGGDKVLETSINGQQKITEATPMSIGINEDLDLINKFQFKITHSTEPLENINFVDEAEGLIVPKIKPLSLSEVEEVVNGYNWKTEFEKANLRYGSEQHSFFLGFKAHQELTKDKLFTLSFVLDLIPKVLEKHKELSGSDFNDWYNSDFLKMLFPKKEWSVTFDEQGKIKLI